MKNWAETVDVVPREQRAPRNLIELQNLVRNAAKEARSVRAFGSAWSFTDCWVSQDCLIETTRLKKIFAFSQGREVWGHTDPGQTTDAGDESRVLIEAVRDEALGTERRFAHVEAGIKLADLLTALDHPASRGRYPGRDIAVRPGQPARGRWTLNTMGGAVGQSLAGALSTGTHGGDFNLPPLDHMVRAIHLVAADGAPHWIERSGANSLTSPAKFAAMGRLVGVLSGLVPGNIHYDDELFNAVLVSLGRFGVAYAFVIEVRPQCGISERVRDTTWRELRNHLLSGELFTGSLGIDWLRDHPGQLSDTARSVDRRARGLSIFINPYRIGDNYTSDPQPNRRAVLVTHAEAVHAFDDRAHVRPPEPDDLGKAHLIADFERASDLRSVRGVIDGVISMLRPNEATNGYPIAASVFTATGGTQPVLGMEIVVSTVDNAHVDLIDRLLAGFDLTVLKYWGPSTGSGARPKFAGGINLRFTRPSSALLAMQKGRTPVSPEERFCHIEIILLKEVRPLPEPVHDGHHNLESRTEDWVLLFEQIATQSGARLHWGQLHDVSRTRVERGYPDTLPRWRRILTRFASSGPAGTFGNNYTLRAGLEPSSETLAAVSWGPNRYDLFGYDERGLVRQLFFAPGWGWANLGNGFPGEERFVGPLTATSWGANRIDVFGLGKRGTMLQLWWAGSWNWTDLALSFPSVFPGSIPLTGEIAATSPGPNRIEIFGLAENGRVWRFWFGDRGWRSADLGNSFPAGERFIGRLAAVSDAPGRIHVFGLGRRGQLLQLRRRGGTDEEPAWEWNDLASSLSPEQFPIAGPITAASPSPDAIDIHALGIRSNIVRLSWRNRWSGTLLSPAFPGRVSTLGTPRHFGESPSLDNSYRFDERRCAADGFVGPLTAVAAPHGQHVFGFGRSGSILQMWRGNDAQPWNWSDLDNGWIRDPQKPITELVVDVRMGGDGLDRDFLRRNPSKAEAWLTWRDGVTTRVDLNQNAEWPRFSLQTRTIPLPAGKRLGDLREFTLHSETAGSHINADNWSVDSIHVRFVSPNGGGTLFYRCGAPLARFTLAPQARDWRFPVELPRTV